jgi:hypothetical protein
MILKNENKDFLLEINKQEVLDSIEDLRSIGFDVSREDDLWKVSIGNSRLDWFYRSDIIVEDLGDKTKVTLNIERLSGTNGNQCDIINRAFRRVKSKIEKEGVNWYNLLID